MMYDNYIDTGEFWIKSIPASWKIMRLKSKFTFGKGLPITKADLTEVGTPVISYGQVHAKYNTGIGLSDYLYRFVPTSYLTSHSQCLVHKNDFIIADTSEDRTGCGNCAFVDKELPLFAGYHSIILRSKESRDNKYLAYLFLTDAWRTQIRAKVDGVKLFSISKTILGSTSVILPPREEQDQIVRYLDWQISRINKLINGYRRQIKLLEERKLTIIDNAVTKGVRRDRSMQSIQGNWMGKIPADWEMVPAKRLFAEGKQRKTAEDKPATASQKYGIILQEDYMQKENKRIVIATQGLEDWKHVNPDDFVISLRSFQGGIERSEITGCVTWHYIVLLPQKWVVPRYFKWLLKSKKYIKALQGTSEFIRDGQDLRYSNFVKIDLPLISESEQIEIAEYIEQKTAEIDDAIPVFEKQIALLNEYRTRLISDVVTGQMDVRGIEIPDYVPEEDEYGAGQDELEESDENAGEETEQDE